MKRFAFLVLLGGACLVFVESLPGIPDGAPYGFAIALDPQGRVVHNLQDPEGRRLSHITSVVRHGPHLYFGSYRRTAVGRLRYP